MLRGKDKLSSEIEAADIHSFLSDLDADYVHLFAGTLHEAEFLLYKVESASKTAELFLNRSHTKYTYKYIK